MIADSLRFIVLSGVLFCRLSPCRCACCASASAPHVAQPSNVQASCLDHAWPAAFRVGPGALAATSTAAPGRRCGERKRQAEAEGETKGGGTPPPASPVCTWGWRGTPPLRRRAAHSAKPGPMQACPRASHDRTRPNLQEQQP
jgi:hypothetical protein